MRERCAWLGTGEIGHGQATPIDERLKGLEQDMPSAGMHRD